MQNEIEQMAKAVEQARIKAADTTNSMNYGFGGWYAKELYNAGYRKSSEVAREILEEIESISSDFPIYGNINTVILSERDLAFIKKKYTEGENNDR